MQHPLPTGLISQTIEQRARLLTRLTENLAIVGRPLAASFSPHQANASQLPLSWEDLRSSLQQALRSAY